MTALTSKASGSEESSRSYTAVSYTHLGTVVYEAEQTLLEPLAGEDAALADAFRLPDGTDPFTS